MASKKQCNARLESGAIEILKSVASENKTSVANVIEALAFWLGNDDGALANYPLELREAIANRAAGKSSQGVEGPDLANLSKTVETLAMEVAELKKPQLPAGKQAQAQPQALGQEQLELTGAGSFAPIAAR
jgi:hypothetical protein